MSRRALLLALADLAMASDDYAPLHEVARLRDEVRRLRGEAVLVEVTWADPSVAHRAALAPHGLIERLA